jgi:Uma2 family endonuclease
MTLAPLPEQPQWPEWLIPPEGGFTADDFLQMKGLPRHTEFIDGSLIFVSPQQKWHSRVINLLWLELDRQAARAATGLRADREMAVRLDDHQVPEPDVLVVTAESYDRTEPSTHYWAEDVVLVVEAVSPDSQARDHDTKPRKYAATGIRHFWLVEEDHGKTVVYVYELNPVQRTYTLTGIHHDRLTLSVPFDLDIDLTAVGEPPS